MGKADTVIGLDLGKYAVKAAWVRVKGGIPSVIRTEELRLPPEGSDATPLIASWAEQMGIAKTSCVVGLPGQQTMFQPFLLPPGDPRTIEQAAAMEVVKFNEMASETMLYDLAPFELNTAERRFLVSMARPTIVDQLVDTATNIGAKIIDVVPRPVALLNALESAGETSETPSVYVNIGHTTTELAIGSANGMMFARTFSSGGQMFTEALARAGDLSLSRAEELKTANGFVPSADSRAESPLVPVADLWIAELQSCLSVYNSLFPERSAQPSRLVLTGGASQLRGLREYIAEKMQMQTVYAESLPGSRKPEDATLYAVAVGLALSGLKLQRVALSLLPVRIRDELVFREQKGYWIAACVAGGLILAVSLVGGYRDFNRRKGILLEQQASLKRCQELKKQIESVKAGNEQILRMADPIRQLVRAAPHFRDLVTLVASNKDSRDYITMVCDSDTYFGSHPLKPPVEGTPEFHRRRTEAVRKAEAQAVATNRILERVMVEGITLQPSQTSVNQLIEALRRYTNLVESADLLSQDKIVTPSARYAVRKGKRFVIDVGLATP